MHTQESPAHTAHHPGAAPHPSGGAPLNHAAVHVAGGLFGLNDTVVLEAALFMSFMNAVSTHPDVHFSMHGASGPISGFHRADGAPGPGGGIKARPGFDGQKAILVSSDGLDKPGDALLFYVHASGIGMPVSIRSFLEVLAVELGLVDITYNPAPIPTSTTIEPWNFYEDPTSSDLPPGYLPGMEGNTTRITMRVQNVMRINPALSLWRKAQLKAWLFMRQNPSKRTTWLFQAWAPRKGELFADSQLHNSKDKKPQRVTTKIEALQWDYYNHPAKRPENYIDSEVKIIVRVEPDLAWSQMIQRWFRNPVAFRENQWLAFLLAKIGFRRLKEFQPAFPERRAQFEKLLSELPHKPGRRTTDPDGVTVGTKEEESLLVLNDIRRERGEDRLTWTQVAPTFTPTPASPDGSVPDPSGLDPNAEIEPLVAIGPLPQPLASPPDAGSGVNPEGGLPDPKSGSGKVVIVKVAIPVDKLKE